MLTNRYESVFDIESFLSEIIAGETNFSDLLTRTSLQSESFDLNDEGFEERKRLDTDAPDDDPTQNFESDKDVEMASFYHTIDVLAKADIPTQREFASMARNSLLKNRQK